LAIELEFLKLCRFPEFLDCGPRLASTVGWFFKIFLRVVVCIALRSIETPIEISLLVINNVENIEIIVLECIISGALKTDFSLLGHAKGFD